MQSYPHIGLQRKGYQIFAEGAKRFLVAELRFGQRSGLSETGRRPMEDIQTDVEFRISFRCDPVGGRNSQIRRPPEHALPPRAFRPRPPADGPD